MAEDERLERAPSDLGRLQDEEREREQYEPRDDEPGAVEADRRPAASCHYKRLASRSRLIASAPVPSCVTVIGSGFKVENGMRGFVVLTPEPSGYS